MTDPLYQQQATAMHIAEIKDTAEVLRKQIAELPGRETSIALTRLDECVMWAIKGATA